MDQYVCITAHERNWHSTYGLRKLERGNQRAPSDLSDIRILMDIVHYILTMSPVDGETMSEEQKLAIHHA